jgi:putative Mn2+ efflux pump MntP
MPSSRDEYVELLKSTALSLGKREIMPLLLSQLPKALTTGFLGAVLSPVLGFIVGKVLEIAIRETEIGAFFLYIDLRTSAQGRDFEKTMQANLDAQKNGTPDQKAKAEKELKDAFKAFVKLTN